MKQTSKGRNKNMQDKLLSQTDIQYAIDYFGVVELLDNIGFAAISSYLDVHKGEVLLREVGDTPDKEVAK